MIEIFGMVIAQSLSFCMKKQQGNFRLKNSSARLLATIIDSLEQAPAHQKLHSSLAEIIRVIFLIPHYISIENEYFIVSIFLAKFYSHGIIIFGYSVSEINRGIFFKNKLFLKDFSANFTRLNNLGHRSESHGPTIIPQGKSSKP